MTDAPSNGKDDASKWADEFMKVVEAGVVVDEGFMIGWFANAIEVSHDVRVERLGLVTKEELESAVAKAVAEEREACAALCDSVNNYDNPMTARDVADAIRARGEGK